MIERDGVRVRRATRADLEFLVGLMADADVRPYLAAGARLDEDALRDELEHQEREPEAFGRYVIEAEDGGEWQRAGALGFERVNERSRIAHLGGLAVHPRFRGRRLGEAAARLFQRHLIFDLGFHRLQLEVYGTNVRAQRHAERAGWIEEGVKRRAYLLDGEWVDGVLYGLVREDLEARDRGAL